MKLVLRIISFFVLLSFVLTCSGCTTKKEGDTFDKIVKRGYVIVGVKYDAKPFGYEENGVLKGFDIDMAHSIAKELLGNANAVEFKRVTAANRILAINSNQVDMVIATMSVTPQRKQIVDFSRPYFYSGLSILVPKKSKITTIRDLNGKKVVIVYGSTAERDLMMFAPETIIQGYKTYTSGFEALKEGRAAAMTSDDTILLGFAMQNKNFKLLPRRYSKEPYAVAVKKGYESQRLLNKINFAILDMNSTGELRNLKYRWTNY